MSTVTVRDFANELNRSVDELLAQFREAGVSVSDEGTEITAQDKMALLSYLRQKTRAAGAPLSASSDAGERRITLKRKETSELRLGGARGTPTKTVSIEVRKKRTIVKNDSAETTAAVEEARQAAEAAAAEAREAREAAARQAEADAAAEAAAKIAAETAEREAREAAERAQQEADEKLRRDKELHEKQLVDDPLYRQRWEASQSRRRAEENLRRASEMRAANPQPVVTPAAAAAAAPAAAARRGDRRGAADRGGRTELHLAEGKSGKRDKKSRKSSGGRVRVDNQHTFERPTAPVVRDVEVPEVITVGELANRMAVKATDLIKVMMKNGLMATINQSLDQDTAALMVEEMGHRVNMVKASDAEESLEQAAFADVSDAEQLPRPPVVTIMGHVDHGKTSLLDYIRKTRVAAGEAGGITQHIGAYHVETDKGVVSFLDTPGHAAFTRMRARGAQITDVVILVVAADDGVMPQTREAIQHAKAAGAPVVVAITKIDKPEADIDRVKNDLAKEEVIPEEWGGDTQMVGVSSHTGEGVDTLLDAILVQSEILELRAPVEADARGTVVEASLEKGRGPVATVLVRSGTLHQGDVVLSGRFFGRVRALFDEAGRLVKTAGPSIPVQILGLSGVPDAGDDVVVVADERKARELADLREIKMREQKLAQNQALRMDQILARMGEGEIKQLNLMIKADVQGSAEALAESLRKLPSEEVRVNVLSSAIGGINESDVDLALASKAIIIGFNVRADGGARKRIQETGVDVRYYSIIYNVLDDVSDAVSGLLGTETREQIVGIAQVRDVFRSQALGSIAGCLVIEGSVQRSLPIRVLRENTVIYEGTLESLRRFKDDVQKVEAGTECGIGVKDYNDVKVGDQIECFQRVEFRRTIKATAAA
ncbi:translation initiation factor IF-2 [Flagellatimonas centrodinii]|uniref:translation initiation factor IF-2 n=1 Tax=Flagellatimonas centrodinii TaxID=2806210 RepID=UPI001FEF7D84|nr:translation initiation factor IF-2 [Flagellatimonas centrodinii]ULQ45895.1 translation initiation factor IF-2 [Flagellatimonas centrodinii]